MKCRVYERDCILKEDKQDVRSAIIKMGAMSVIKNNGWGASGTRIPKFIKTSKERLQKYDRLFRGNTMLEASYLRDRCIASNIDYPAIEGHGKKAENQADHDMPVMCMVITLHDDFGFRGERLRRFISGIETEIRYYNRAFFSDDRRCIKTVIEVLDSKLNAMGCNV